MKFLKLIINYVLLSLLIAESCLFIYSFSFLLYVKVFCVRLDSDWRSLKILRIFKFSMELECCVLRYDAR